MQRGILPVDTRVDTRGLFGRHKFAYYSSCLSKENSISKLHPKLVDTSLRRLTCVTGLNGWLSAIDVKKPGSIEPGFLLLHKG